MINAVNAKKSGLSSTASMQEIAAYITAYWTGGSFNGNITYERHYHNSSCYFACNSTSFTAIGGGYGGNPGDPYGYTRYRCNNCGYEFNKGSYTESNDPPATCPRPAGYICGYNNGQIIKAIITY